MEPRPRQAPDRRHRSSPGAGAAEPRADVAHLARLDRMAALGELLAEVVHEIRNALVSVKTFVQLQPEAGDDPNAEFREIASAEFARVERLLGAVLAQATGEAAPQAEQTCELDAVAASLADLVSVRAARSGVALESDLMSASVVAIGADALRQILLNLLLNALAVTAEGEAVRVVTRTLGRAAEIRVEDRGPGIPRHARRRIFEPYYSTRSARAGGLGLAISRRLVEDSGGTLTVTDREGGGSCFRVRIPVSR